MTWTADTPTQGTYGSNDPNTVNHTCSANAKLLVVVLFVNGNTARTGGAPTYNSAPMTDSGQGFVVETECGAEVWYLINPDTGSSYTVSVPNTGSVNFDISVMSFVPSAGGATYDNSNSATGTTQDPSLSLTVSATGNLIIGGLGSGDRDVPTAGTDFSLVHTYDAGNQTWGSEYDLAGSATPVTVDFGTARADDWGLIGISFEEVVGDLNINLSGANADDIEATDSVTADVSDPQVSVSDSILLADSGPDGYINKVLATQPSNLLAYWPLNETSGTNADNAEGTATRDGTYTGVDLNQIAGPDLQPAGLWDASADYCDIYSTSLRDAFDGDEGTASIWIKAESSGVWTDSAARTLLRLRSDASNYIYISKLTVDNRITFRHSGGGTEVLVNDDTAKTIGWYHLAITWSVSGNAFKAYLNGTQTGSTQTGVATWGANLLGSTTTVIGALNTSPQEVWDGYIGGVAVWDTVLSDGQIAQLAEPSSTDYLDVPLEINVQDNIDAIDSVTVNVANLVVSVSDDATITDSVTADVSDPQISVQDDATVTDSVNLSGLGVGDLSVNVSDDATVTESVTLDVSDPQVNVSDNATATDSTTTSITLEIYSQDDVTATDSATASISLEINNQDDVEITDSVTADVSDPQISVSDDATATDSVTVSPGAAGELDINVSDNATVRSYLWFYDDYVVATDSATVSIPVVGFLSVNVQDDVEVTDSVTVDVQIDISAQDDVEVTDSVTVAVSDPQVVVSDDVTITDSVTLDIALNITVQDDATATDNVTVSIQADISEQDNIEITDSANVDLQVDISVQDDVTVTDSVTLEITEQISIADDVEVTDAATVYISDYYITVQDDVAVADSISVDLQIDVIVQDDAEVADSTSVNIPDYSFDVSVQDDATATDSTIVFTDLPVTVQDNVTATDATTLNIPGYSLDLNVQDDARVSDSTIVIIQVPGEFYVIESDDVLVSESVSLTVSDPQISVQDDIEVTDSVAVSLQADVAVQDDAAVTDQATANIEIDVTVQDDVETSDQATAEISLNVTVQDDVVVSDAVSALIDILYVSASDDATVTDTTAVDLQVDVSVADDATVTDAASVNLPGYSFDVSVADDVEVTDSITVQTSAPGTLDVNVSDDVDVTDTVSLFTDTLYLSRQDDIIVTDSVTVSLGAVAFYEVTVSDDAIVTDTSDVDVVTEITVTDDASLTDSQTTVVSTEVIALDDVEVTDSVAVIIISAQGITTFSRAEVYDSISVTVSDPNISIIDNSILSENVFVSVSAVGLPPDALFKGMFHGIMKRQW